jgi:UDP-glucose 6-dehydrogenase
VNDIKNIAVCGLGKLGSSIAVVFAVSGFKVTGFDIDSVKVNCINRGEQPVSEAELGDYLRMPEVVENLKATSHVYEAVQNSSACFFVTPTPSLADGSFDHTR